MLILIGFLLIYVDILVGSIDVVPDLMGYLLMVPGFFALRSRFRFPRLFAVSLLIGLAASILALWGWNLWVSALLYLVCALSNYGMGLSFLKALTAGPQWKEDSHALMVQTVKTALLLILLIAVFSIPLSALSAVVEWICLIFEILAGLFTVASFYRIYQKEVSHV